VRADVDPRLTYRGPFRNVGPEVRYAGDAACATCHPDIAAKYHDHPMGRSLRTIVAAASDQRYDKQHHNPFVALDWQFEVRRDKDRVVHTRRRLDTAGQPIYEQKADVHYAIGSSTRGVSFLIERDGYLFESPISWYTRKQIWDLSPGADRMPSVGRPVGGSCLFCHANRARPIRSSINRYEEPIFDGYSIGCERCHGPGALHVASRENAEPVPGLFDDTIVNPRHVSHALREAVCQQCHLEGDGHVVRRERALDEYRPGLPQEAFLTVFVLSGEHGLNRQAVNHVQQMHSSRCFQKSTGAGKLDCISCHDPHARVKPEERQAFYRSRCLKCHENRGCSLLAAERRRAANNCIACHMPPVANSDVAHNASTDHRIPRRPDQASRSEDASHRQPWPGLPIWQFPGTGSKPENPDLLRDLGIGLVQMGAAGKIDPRTWPARALELLESAVKRDPSDKEAWLARARALSALNQRAEAFNSYKKVLTMRPDWEEALAGAAALAQVLGRRDEALDYAQRAVEANPWMAGYRAVLVPLLIDAGRWDEVRPHAAAWLRLDPESVLPRQLRITLLLRDGEDTAARAEFANIEALHPPNLEELRTWFMSRRR
jgi:tetratricopeptide (TPR) repeat protein